MRIIIDDAGDIPAELAEKYNIVIIPVNVMFGTEEFLSRVTIDHNSFYEKVKQVGDHNFPKTSQPTPYQFVELYKKLMAEGEDEFLTITVSEKLSGTYASVVAATKELEGQATIHLFDSMGGSSVMGYMAIEAAKMSATGASIEEIFAHLEELRDDMVVAFLIDSLEYAVKGGRVSTLRSAMASLLNIKPIMQLKDGLIVEAAKVRTYKKALDAIVDYVYQRVGDRPIEVSFIHANAPDALPVLKEKARERLNIKEEMDVSMAIPVAINLGPGALGIIAFPVD